MRVRGECDGLTDRCRTSVSVFVVEVLITRTSYMVDTWVKHSTREK